MGRTMPRRVRLTERRLHLAHVWCRGVVRCISLLGSGRRRFRGKGLRALAPRADTEDEQHGHRKSPASDQSYEHELRVYVEINEDMELHRSALYKVFNAPHLVSSASFLPADRDSLSHGNLDAGIYAGHPFRLVGDGDPDCNGGVSIRTYHTLHRRGYLCNRHDRM